MTLPQQSNSEGCDGPQSAERACVKRPTPDPRSGSGRPLSTCDDRLDAAEQRIAELEAERQAVIDCVNLYGGETLHWSLDAAGLLKPKVGE